MLRCFSLHFAHIYAVLKNNILLAFGGTFCSNGSLVAENGGNNCHFSLWIGTIVRPFCNHNVTEMLVFATFRLTTFCCQENSDFWCHEKARFLKKMFFVGKYAENEHFWKMLSINQFHFLDILRVCQSYAMRWSKLWNELVRCGIWGRQMPQVSRSKHSYEGLRCHMWQFRVWRMRKLERKNGFLTWFSSLDWTEKSTKICK